MQSANVAFSAEEGDLVVEAPRESDLIIRHLEARLERVACDVFEHFAFGWRLIVGEEVGWSLVEGREERALGVSEVEGLDWRFLWRG